MSTYYIFMARPADTDTFSIAIAYEDETGDECEVTYYITIPSDAPFTDASDAAADKFYTEYPECEILDM